MRRPSAPAILLATLFVGLGTVLAAYAIGHGLRTGSPASAATTQYAAGGGCPDCPAGTRLDSVELQARQGSTLFVLRGVWPGTVDAWQVGVCIATDTVSVVLTPHHARNLFEVSVTRAGAAAGSIPAAAVATAVGGSVLLIDLAPPAQPSVPTTFDVALCRTGVSLERVPANGELLWDGHAAPRLAQGTATAATPSTAPASPTLVTSTPLAGVDPVALARGCASIPGGSIPPSLQVTGFSSGVQPDPRTGAATQEVTATLAAAPSAGSAPYSLAAVVLPAGAAAPTGRGRPIDLAGVAQLFTSFDGAKLHKALRTFNAGAWTTVADSDATAISFQFADTNVSLYWSGMHPGDHVGFVTATASGCSAFGLNSALVPQLVIR